MSTLKDKRCKKKTRKKIQITKGKQTLTICVYKLETLKKKKVLTTQNTGTYTFLQVKYMNIVEKQNKTRKHTVGKKLQPITEKQFHIKDD